jgi:hypothetical protein
MGYIVFVDDNFHYMDESERYQLGEFPDYSTAVAACKSKVDSFLKGCDPSLGAEKMFSSYKHFGEDPWIKGDDPNDRFSAWTYAWEQCQKLAGPGKTSSSSPAPVPTAARAPEIMEPTPATKPTAWSRIRDFLVKPRFR